MSIANMNFKERSLIFAKLAKIAYYTEKKARFKEMEDKVI